MVLTGFYSSCRNVNGFLKGSYLVLLGYYEVLFDFSVFIISLVFHKVLL